MRRWAAMALLAVGCSGEAPTDPELDGGTPRDTALPDTYPRLDTAKPDTELIDTWGTMDTSADDGAVDATDAPMDGAMTCTGAFTILGSCLASETDGGTRDCYAIFGAADRPSSETCGVSPVTGFCPGAYSSRVGATCPKSGATFACRRPFKNSCCATVTTYYNATKIECPTGSELISPP